MLRSIVALVLTATLLTLSLIPVKAQTNDLSVRFNGSYITGWPGSTVAVPVTITGSTGVVPEVGAEIIVPQPLRVTETSTCSAETVFASANAKITERPCNITSWDGPDDSRIISVEIESLSSATGFRIVLLLQIEIPKDAQVGSTYTLSAPNKYFATYQPTSEFIIEVARGSKTDNNPAYNPVIEGPFHDIDGSELEFPIGSIKPFSFEISYDTFPEASSASLVLYADRGHIEVSDPSVVDWRASYACYDDPTSDYNSRAPKRSVAVLPTEFRLTFGRWLSEGTEIRVCAEIVYYNGSTVLGVERHKSVILVVYD